MKKFTLIAFAAAATLGANAQYTAESPYMEPIVKAGAKVIDAVVCDQASLDAAAAAGVKVNDLRVDDVNRFFYIWDGTFNAGDGSYPGVGYNDMQFDGYTAVEVASVGWSGAGYCIVTPADLSHMNENTRIHLAYRSTNAPASIAVIICDGKLSTGEVSAPAKVALGDPFVDNGAVFPAVAPKAAEDWQALDISFSDLKKLFPAFDFKAGTTWDGNIVSILAGGVTGQNVSIDALYFYNNESTGVETIEEDADFFVTGKTVNSTVNGIELYDLAGRRIAATEGTVIGLDNLANGIYVAKSGKKAQKVIVR